MTTLTSTLNSADTLVRLFRSGHISALALSEQLTALGFYDVQWVPLTACYAGVRYPFPATEFTNV